MSTAFDLVCNVFDAIGTCISTVFTYITRNKLETSSPVWISVCQYIPSCGNLPAITSDEYSRFFDADLHNWSNDLDARQYYIFKQSYRDAVNRTMWDSSSYSDAIVIGQICPAHAIVKSIKNADAEKDLTGLILNSTPPEFNIRNYINPSTARFLEIEYKCGTYAPVPIQVPKSHYIAGNELLSKTYVLRYLEHLPIYVKWKFDESDYSLRIIDGDSEVFSLTGTQYILLAEDGYKIIDCTKLNAIVE